MPERPPQTKQEAREIIDEKSSEINRLTKLASERSRGGSPDDAKELSELAEGIEAEIREIEDLIASLPDEQAAPENEPDLNDDQPAPTEENFSETTTLQPDDTVDEARRRLREILPDLNSNNN